MGTYVGAGWERKMKKKKKNLQKSPASLKDALEYYSFKVSSYLLPGQVPQGEEYSPGGCRVHSSSPSELPLNYLFLVPVPDTMLLRETKSIEPSHSDLLEE